MTEIEMLKKAEEAASKFCVHGTPSWFARRRIVLDDLIKQQAEKEQATINNLNQDELIKKHIARLTAEKESLVAKFITEKGVQPSEVCIVETRVLNGIAMYVDLIANVKGKRSRDRK
jgi:hypothetical protein